LVAKASKKGASFLAKLASLSFGLEAVSGYTQCQLDKIALRLNQRPRKTLGLQAPATELAASVAPTI
jgi:hypothetical protein